MILTSSTASWLRSIEKISKRPLATILAPQCACCRQAHHLPFLHLQAASDRHNDPDHFCAVCSLKRKLIIIIDDVITPGAILRAAAAALKNGGAEIAQRRRTRYCRRRERGYKALISHRQNELSAKRLLSRASKYACVSTGSRNISSRV